MTPSHPALVSRHGPAEGSSEPLSGLVISVVLSMLSMAALSAFATQRYLAVSTWKQLPLVQWLVFAIYADSTMFVVATAVIQFAFGVGYSGAVCESAILLCLVCYVTTKLIYMFLVEKAYIIRSGNKKPRLKSRLYIFNSFGMIGAYCMVVVPNFVLRFARVENGECIIGMQRPAMIPLIVFDLLVNAYLTIIFLKPLSGLYSYKNFDHAPGSKRLKTMAVRTFVGCICTLTSSIVNLSVLVGLNGEPGWVCLMCCNSDILFSAAVIHWVTSRDSTNSSTTDDTVPSSNAPNHHHHAGRGGDGGDELSAIPPRAAHHRLHSLDHDEHDVDRDIESSTKRHNNSKTSRNRQSQISLGTESGEAIIDAAGKMSISRCSDGSGDGDDDSSPCSSTTVSGSSSSFSKEGTNTFPSTDNEKNPSPQENPFTTDPTPSPSPSRSTSLSPPPSSFPSNNNNTTTTTIPLPPLSLYPSVTTTTRNNNPPPPTTRPPPNRTRTNSEGLHVVRVDTAYSTTTTTTTAPEEAIRLGNTVVITGTGGGAVDGRRIG